MKRVIAYKSDKVRGVYEELEEHIDKDGYSEFWWTLHEPWVSPFRHKVSSSQAIAWLKKNRFM